MAAEYRAPKAVQEEAAGNEGELALRLSSPLSIEDVLEIRTSWVGDAGIAWATKITDDISQRAALLTKGTEMTEVRNGTSLTIDMDSVMAKVTAIDALVDDLMADLGCSDNDDAAGDMSMEANSAERAKAARIGEGTFVSWPNTDGSRNQGKVEKVTTKGPVTSTQNYTLEAVPDFPVFSIRVYKKQGNGYNPTDVVVVQRADTLTVITSLPAPRSVEETEMIEERKTMIRSAETITMQTEVRAIATDDGSLKIGGYAATFNQEASGLNFREMIAPGAFTRTLQMQDPIFLLVNHNTEGLPLASTQSQTLRLSEDSIGLRMEADLDPANPFSAALASALTRGDVNKMSFAFTVAPNGDTREAGLRTLTDLDLYEVSIVTWPAYDSTSASMRTAEEAEKEAAELRQSQLKLKLQLTSRKK